MKGKIFLFTLFLLAGFSLYPENISSVLSQAEQDWLQDHNEILFVSQTDYPPFEFKGEEDSSDGMSIELIRWIATEFGFKARFRHMSFQQAQEAVLNREADALTSLFYSEKRDERFDFTPLTWEVPALIFVQSDRPDIRSLEDLRNRRVAMQRGDYAEEYLLQKGITATILPTDTFAEAVNLVIAGKADAVIGDKQIVLYHLFSSNLMDKVKSVGDPLYIGQNSIAVVEGNSLLQSILKEGVILARENGIFDKIDRKWTGVRYSDSRTWLEKNQTFLIIAMISILIIMGLIIFWILQLRSLVAKRTDELKRNELHLQSLFDSVPDLLWLKDSKGKYLKCNNRYRQFLGLDESRIRGKTDHDFFSKDKADLYSEYDRIAMEKGEASYIANIQYKNDGHGETVEVIKNSLHDEKGNLVGILSIAHDITERLEAETFLDTIVENIPNMIFVKDAETLRFIRFNKAAERIVGYSAEELKGKNDYDFFPRDEADFFTRKDREALERTEITDIAEEPIQSRDGQTKILHTQKISIRNKEGKPVYLLGISEDITERKQIENEMRKTLKEKEILLKEVHHRVKNNLQVVSSLLSLQSEKTKDLQALEAFAEAENKVKSMSLVHEILYKSENFDRIPIRKYLENLMNHLREMYVGRNIDIAMNAEDIDIQLENAVSCGLIFTELLSNSYKHAFGESESGSVKIEVRRIPEGKIQAEVSDNGCGLPDDFNPDVTASMGIRLIIDLIEGQLEGEWSVKKDKGTVWIFTWPNG
ncbi:PAS domain S-box protein [Spirochaeta isovalerica]|uniref:histidine kinase n=1 Tax=Spirochaeta isovalerica TaxID=150 RepID=A0A841R8F7_9SPIO|nr:PAS domain S-box protein [Spirochaeta isovalerica]MBB6480096.1 PAS domain S-box-containing protein [Spirochaeta isovalerica]